MTLSFYAAFRDGALHLGSTRGILRIEVVPAVKATKLDLKSPAGPHWQACFPRLRLDRLLHLVDKLGLDTPPDWWASRERSFLAPPDVLDTAEACLAFLRAADVELCRTLAKFGTLHFTMLYHAARLPAFRRLIDANRGLAFALAVRVAGLRREPQRALVLLDSLLKQREKEIAEALDFPPGSWKILKRLCPGALTAKRLRGLRGCLWRPEKMRIARHLPRLGSERLGSARLLPGGWRRISAADRQPVLP